MAIQVPTRLGDILIRMKRIKPHQLGVALEVQRRIRIPLGQVLIGINLITPRQLRWALLRQKLMRLLIRLRGTPQQLRRYGSDLTVHGRDLLEKHLVSTARSAPASPSAVSETEDEKEARLRAELAGLPPGRVARIVEKDDDLKERIITGNF